MSDGATPGAVEICVVEANAIAHEGDVLVMKYAQALYGLDEMLVQHLAGRGIDLSGQMPAAGEVFYHHGEMGSFVPKSALFLGTRPLGELDDDDFFGLGYRPLEALWREAPGVRQVLMTPHVPPGTKVGHTFALQLRGIQAAAADGKIPVRLERIVVMALESVFVRECGDIVASECPGGVIKVGAAGAEGSGGAGE